MISTLYLIAAVSSAPSALGGMHFPSKAARAAPSMMPMYQTAVQKKSCCHGDVECHVPGAGSREPADSGASEWARVVRNLRINV